MEHDFSLHPEGANLRFDTRVATITVADKSVAGGFVTYSVADLTPEKITALVAAGAVVSDPRVPTPKPV